MNPTMNPTANPIMNPTAAAAAATLRLQDGDIGDTSQNTLNRDEFRQGAMMEPTVLHALALYDGLV